MFVSGTISVLCGYSWQITANSIGDCRVDARWWIGKAFWTRMKKFQGVAADNIIFSKTSMRWAMKQRRCPTELLLLASRALTSLWLLRGATWHCIRYLGSLKRIVVVKAIFEAQNSSNRLVVLARGVCWELLNAGVAGTSKSVSSFISDRVALRRAVNLLQKYFAISSLILGWQNV